MEGRKEGTVRHGRKKGKEGKALKEERKWLYSIGGRKERMVRHGRKKGRDGKAWKEERI